MLLIETDYGNMNIDINTKIGKYEIVEKTHLLTQLLWVNLVLLLYDFV